MELTANDLYLIAQALDDLPMDRYRDWLDYEGRPYADDYIAEITNRVNVAHDEKIEEVL